jgi:DNA topoisomerase VI subunit B
MHVSVICGTGGHQAVGEVTSIDLKNPFPRVVIGSTVLSIKSIREINKLPTEMGNPKQFKKLQIASNKDPVSLFAVLADSSVPIFRSLLMMRTTSGITENEFEIELRDETTGETKTVKELLNPISGRSKDLGTTVVLNTSSDEQIEWLVNQLKLTGQNATSNISVMGSSSAILSQIDNISNPRVIAVVGRNERQINAAADAVRTVFAYSQNIERKDHWSLLPYNTELVSFRRAI